MGNAFFLENLLKNLEFHFIIWGIKWGKYVIFPLYCGKIQLVACHFPIFEMDFSFENIGNCTLYSVKFLLDGWEIIVWGTLFLLIVQWILHREHGKYAWET